MSDHWASGPSDGARVDLDLGRPAGLGVPGGHDGHDGHDTRRGLPGLGDWLVESPVVDRRRTAPDRTPANERELRPVTHVGAWLGLAVAAVAAPALADPIQLSWLTRSLALAVAIMGLQVLLGHGGLLSLGQGALLGLGAWTAGELITDLGLRGELAVPVTAIALAVAGVVIGLPGLRLSRIGLVLLTLAVAVSFPLLFQKFVGPLGRPYDRVVPPAWTGLDETDDGLWAYGLAVVVAAVSYGALRLVLGGRFGRSLRAVRDEPQAAAAFGVPVARVRLAAFALSAALAGAGGALLVVQTPFVYGPDFPFQLSIQLFAVVLVLGADRLGGAVAGGLWLVLLPRALRVVGLAGYVDLVYALVLLAAIVALRGRGIGPLVERWSVTGRLGRDRRPPVGAAVAD
ncbi:MAG: branched-chain amino acid ABC transporter permease [Actinomycetota bacterium]